ncbi:MAG: hypothetical protein ACLSUW_07495 [Akkermansia sp.]
MVISRLRRSHSFMDALEEKGVQIVDTTCGDVMKVWKRVKNYAAMGITSLSTVRLPMRKPALRLPGSGEREGEIPGGLRFGGCPYPVRLHHGPRRPRGILKRFEGCCSWD